MDNGRRPQGARPEVSIGLDIGSPTLLVGQTGFDRVVVNDMAGAGRWETTDALPTLALVPDLVPELLLRERIPPVQAGVCVAVPAWFGLAERHALAEHLAPATLGVCRSTMVSTTLCLAVSSFDRPPHARAAVLAVDARIGCGVSVVAVDAGQVIELGGSSVAPAHPLDLGAMIDDVLVASSKHGVEDAHDLTAVVLLVGDDDRTSFLGETMRHLGVDAPVVVLADGHAVAAGAVRLGGAAGDGWAPIASGSLHRAMGIGPSGAVLVEPHAFLPAVRTRTVTVEPDVAGVDVVELRPGVRMEGGAAGRTVATLLLAPHQARGVPTELTLALGVDGRTAVSPIDRWSLRLPPSSDRAVRVVDLAFAPGPTSDADEVVPLDPHPAHGAIAAVAAAAGAVGIAVTSAAIGDDDLPQVVSAAAVSEAMTEMASDPGTQLERVVRAIEEEVDEAEQALVVLALWRVERRLSEDLGRLVAVRSNAAALGVDDHVDAGEIVAAATRVLEAWGSREDDLADALRTVASSATRVPVIVRWGGTSDEIEHELDRVVDHLRVVVGTISEPERRRLVHDALLLGLDGPSALEAVERAMRRSGGSETCADFDLGDQIALIELDPANALAVRVVFEA